MKSLSVALVSLAVLMTLAGCRSPEERTRRLEEKQLAQEAKRLEQELAFKASIPADSPLAQIELGMTEGEVGALLGQPQSQDQHVTGKAYNPFNFTGRDTMRMTYYYAGIGRVEFSSGSWGQRYGAIKLMHDPEEPGYRRSR